MALYRSRAAGLLRKLVPASVQPRAGCGHANRFMVIVMGGDVEHDSTFRMDDKMATAMHARPHPSTRNPPRLAAHCSSAPPALCTAH